MTVRIPSAGEYRPSLGMAKRNFEKYLATKKAEFEAADIDRCEYYEPNDDGDIQCENVGVALQLTDLSGRKMIQYRCEEHGWEPGVTTLHMPPIKGSTTGWCGCPLGQTKPLMERNTKLRAHRCETCRRWIPDHRLLALENYHESR